MLISIECRDRSRPVGVSQLEAFWAKCQDTRIDQGIIVSSNGFYKSVVKKAKFLGIRCLRLDEALSFNWLLASGMRLNYVTITHTHWTFVLDDERENLALTDYCLLDGEKNEIEIQNLNGSVTDELVHLQQNPDYEYTGTETIYFSGSGFFIRDNLTGQIYSIKHIVADAQYEVRNEISPFGLFRYSEEERDGHLGEAAVAKIKLGEIEADFTFVNQPGKGTTGLFSLPKDSGHIVSLRSEKST